MNFSNQLIFCFTRCLTQVQTNSSLPCSEIRHLLSTAHADSTGQSGLENNKFNDKKCCRINFFWFSAKLYHYCAFYPAPVDMTRGKNRGQYLTLGKNTKLLTLLTMLTLLYYSNCFTLLKHKHVFLHILLGKVRMLLEWAGE